MKVIVNLAGGFGNQLFCYSFGYALAKRKNAELIIDTSTQDNGLTRSLELMKLNIRFNHRISYKYKKGFFERAVLNKIRKRKAIGFTTKIYNEINPTIFEDAVFDIQENTYFKGNWQSEKYFINYRDELLEMLTPKEERNVSVRNLCSEMNNCNSVAVHIRRGDYVGMSLYRIYLLATNADIVWFAFATSTDMIFLTVFLMIFYIRIEGFRPKFNWQLGKRLLKQSYHYLIAGLITILYAQVDRIMLGNMLDKASVGYYSATLTISTLWSMIPTALIQSISPILYDAAEKDRTFYLRRLRQSYAVLFWLNATYSIFVGAFAHWIILLLYGKDYLAGTAALRIVVWYYGLSTMSTLNQVYLANDGKNKYINLFCIAGLVTDVVLNFALIPIMGINGAAIATLITHIVIQIVMPYAFKETREIAVCIIRGALLQDVISKEEMQIIKGKAKKVLRRG